MNDFMCRGTGRPRAIKEVLSDKFGNLLTLEEGTLKKAREYCRQAERLGEQAIDALSPLRALGLDLPQASLDLMHDTAVRLENQFRRLAGDRTAKR